MSGQKIIDGRQAVLDGRVTFIGWDMGDPAGDFFALMCPNCSHVHRFRGPQPKRCHHCRRRQTNLRVVK